MRTFISAIAVAVGLGWAFGAFNIQDSTASFAPTPAQESMYANAAPVDRPLPRQTAEANIREAGHSVRREGIARAACQRVIKNELRDPGSVEWINRLGWLAHYYAAEDIYFVFADYRARNGFGGMSQERSVCAVAVNDRGGAASKVVPAEAVKMLIEGN